MMQLDQILRTVMKFRETIPVNVRGLALALGLRVIDRELDKDTSGLLKKTSDDDFIIEVNAIHPETRKRFTIAHEIAHFVLHRHLLSIGDQIQDNVAYRAVSGIGNNKISPEHEREANKFAANLLMPPAKIIEYCDKGTYSIQELSKVFNVSVSAMQIRAGKLITGD